jgi:hypothetical protein
VGIAVERAVWIRLLETAAKEKQVLVVEVAAQMVWVVVVEQTSVAMVQPVEQTVLQISRPIFFLVALEVAQTLSQDSLR